MCVRSVAQLCLTLWDRVGWSQPGSSVHRIFQRRILEWVAIAYSRQSSWPMDGARIFYFSCIGTQTFITSITWESHWFRFKYSLGAHRVGSQIQWRRSINYNFRPSRKMNGNIQFPSRHVTIGLCLLPAPLTLSTAWESLITILTGLSVTASTHLGKNQSFFWGK